MNKNESDSDREAGPRETGAAGVCPPPARCQHALRHGKIGRLPHAIRTELNQRLLDGGKGAVLLAWLNGLPEVQQVLRDQFGGAELTEENLSRWRNGGFQDWLTEESSKEAVTVIASQGAVLNGVSAESFPQNMAQAVLARLAMELRHIQSMEDDQARFKCLRDIMWGVIFLRRDEAESERLKRADRKKAGFLLPEEELEKQFWLWASDPDHKESIRRRLFMTKAEKEAAIDYILSDNSEYWAADEAYIKSIGGKLGAKLAEELFRKKAPEQTEKKPGPAPPPEPPPSTGPAP